MRRKDKSPFVLAIAPSPRGFAFVLFDGPTTPFDWGIKELRGKRKNARTLSAITKLVREYHPSALVIEAVHVKDSRRGPRIRELMAEVDGLARDDGISVFRYGRSDIKRTFAQAGARTRPEIAKAIAEQIPALAPRLPPLRKIWMSEDPRQSLFDAASLGFVFFAKATRSL